MLEWIGLQITYTTKSIACNSCRVMCNFFGLSSVAIEISTAFAKVFKCIHPA